MQMIESSLIDDAGHGNDIVAHLQCVYPPDYTVFGHANSPPPRRSEVLEFNEVTQYLIDYTNAHINDTTLLGTPDHECGGLTLGGIITSGDDQFNPEPLSYGRRSSEILAREWQLYNGTDPEETLRTLYADYGVFNPNSTEMGLAMKWKNDEKRSDDLMFLWGRGLARRAMFKWGTDGHSAVGAFSRFPPMKAGCFGLEGTDLSRHLAWVCRCKPIRTRT